MAENPTKLTPEIVNTMTYLTNVRRISDLNTINIYDNTGTEIRTSSEFDNSYLLSSTYLGDRYYNYRVKLNELTQYIHDLGAMEVAVFKRTFDFFIQSLRDNTVNSYVKFVPANEEINSEDPDSNYSYTFNYQLSSVQQETFNPFSYNDGEDSSYAYTNVLSPGLVTAEVLEDYVRKTIGRILGVPNTPAAAREAIDSVIEFVDWFKGYVVGDTSYGSLHQLISTIESKDREVLEQSYSYTLLNRDLSYAYTELNTNLVYNYVDTQISGVDVDLVAGRNISIDPDTNAINSYVSINSNNKIRINNVTYVLSFNNNTGELSINVDVDNFTSFTVNVSGGGTTDYEYYSNISSRDDISLTATANKECTWTNWSTSSSGASVGTSTTSNNGKTLTATGSHDSANNCTSTKTFSWTVSASHTPTSDEQDHGHTTTENSGTKTVSVKYTFNKFKSAVFASTQDINSINISGTDNQPTIQTTNGGIVKTTSSLPSTFGSFNVNSSNGDCYIYFLLPSDWVVSGKGFKWRGNETMAESPGSSNIRTFNLYNNSKGYTLFRSQNRFPNGEGINFEYV